MKIFYTKTFGNIKYTASCELLEFSIFKLYKNLGIVLKYFVEYVLQIITILFKFAQTQARTITQVINHKL